MFTASHCSVSSVIAEYLHKSIYNAIIHSVLYILHQTGEKASTTAIKQKYYLVYYQQLESEVCRSSMFSLTTASLDLLFTCFISLVRECSTTLYKRINQSPVKQCWSYTQTHSLLGQVYSRSLLDRFQSCFSYRPLLNTLKQDTQWHLLGWIQTGNWQCSSETRKKQPVGFILKSMEGNEIKLTKKARETSG